MTIKELAKIAGVSYSTVSKSLNDSSEISPETKARIKKLAEEHNCFINTNARNLKTKRSNTIAIIFSRDEFYGHNVSILCNTLMNSISQEIERHNYNFLVNVSHNKDGESYVKLLHSQGLVDGFILATWDPMDEEIDYLNRYNVPYAFAIMSPKPIDGVAYFLNDNRAEGYLATKYLIGKGLDRIVTITSCNSADRAYEERTQGYCQAMEEANLTPQVIFHSMNHLQAHQLLFSNIDTFRNCNAVYVQWDGLAGTFMQELTLQGFRVPDDISIIGHNDYYIATYFVPLLTTVHDARSEQIRKAVDYVVQRISGTDSVPEVNKATGYIVERDSVIR